MRAAFSRDNLLREERASLLCKVVVRSMAACVVIAIVAAIIILKFVIPSSLARSSSVVVMIPAVVFVSVMLGCAISMIVYAATIVKFRNLLSQISQENPDWKLLDGEYMGSDVRHYYLSVRKLHNIVSSEVRMAAIGKMSSHIAHDMRSPLSVLKSYIAANPDGDRDDAHEFHEAAERSVQKLVRMADDLVNYSKANVIERSRQHISKIIADAVAETKSLVAERRVGLKQNIDGDLWINIDGYKFERVLVNLVNNAIQACGEDGVVVLSAEESGDDTLVVKVEDNGGGIEQDHLVHVFDAFFTKGKRSGTGLGLAYCKQVVEAHGGTIGVESEVGKGTVVTIRMPMSMSVGRYHVTIRQKYN